jgi:hypothetical protein
LNDSIGITMPSARTLHAYKERNKSFESQCKRHPYIIRGDYLVSNQVDRISTVKRGGKDVNKSKLANKQRAA